ncbi:MAG: beta-CASP ribonuclease aCPSF1 [Aigarchaeota archaeon]|nr:beta-CASP ribonuclease aCPSF1 [Aigarchaeota archaeon]MDW8092516.1 beta-CASP ribonuclease aCPSF1 [Nitrososphaerota archaeon]
MFSLDKLRAEVLKYLAEMSGDRTVATKIDYEGPRLAIYIQNREAFVDRGKIAKELVNLIKKRVIIRPDESIRLPKEEVERIIESELGRYDYSLFFDEELGEVNIEMAGADQIVSSELVSELEGRIGWVINLMRSPPIPSRTIEKMRRYIYGEGERRVDTLRSIGERVFRDQLFEPGEVTVMMLGGGMQVGRSAILLKTRESTVLLDCGINAGSTSTIDMLPRIDAYPDIINELDAVVITHSHMDHHGALPLLFKYGYRGPVYMTEPTLPLMLMEQLDYVSLAGKEGFFPLYSEGEVRLEAQHTICLKYNLVTNITPDIRLAFYNAGHIMGSAIAHIHVGEGFHNVIYTGDFKFEKSMILDPAVCKFPRAETLIMESTYGATPVPFTREESEGMLAEHIQRTISRHGVVLIPVPSVGRAQEIMLIIKSLFERRQIPEAPIILDGLLIEATAIHTMYVEYLSRELQEEIRTSGNVFLSEYFTIIKSHQQREEVLTSKEPSIILATSGMLEGGPVLKYFRELAGDEKNSLLFVSYQVEGTLGRRLLNGAREINLVDETGKQELLRVAMDVEKVEGFSGHSSRQQLLNYIRRVTPKPRKILLVHGEREAINSLMRGAQKIAQSEIYAPRNLETLNLVD